MKKYVKAKRGAKISAFVLSFLFVVTSMTTTYAASYGAAGVHDELYQEAGRKFRNTGIRRGVCSGI